MTMIFLAKILFFAAIPVFVVSAYQQSKFLGEWAEDHAQSLNWTSRNRLSVTAILSKSLSERCRERRRKVVIATGLFLGMIVVCALLSMQA